MAKTETEQQSKESAQPTRRPSFYRGVVFSGTGTAVNIFALLLETMVAARLLDPDSYGIYVLLIVVVNFFVMAVDFGCKTAMTKLIAGSDEIRQAALANTGLAFRLLVIAAVSALIWLGQGLLVLVAPSRALLQYAAYIPFMVFVASLDELLLAMLQGYRAYHHMAVAQILRSLLRLCLSILFLIVLDLGVMALIYSWIFSFAISASFLYLVLPLSERFLFRRPLLSEILRFGAPLQGNRFLWFVFGQLDVLLLGTLAGPAAVAFFNVAARIPTALLRLAQSYIAVFFPTMAALLSTGERARARQLLDHSLRLISFAVGLVALTAVLFSQQIITLLFSDKYVASSGTFAVLMIALHMSVVVGMLGYTLTAAGFPGRSLAVSAIRASVLVVADLLLIPVFGFMGAAFARLIADYVANPVAVRVLWRCGIMATVAPYVKQTALLLLCSVLFWWTQPTAFAHKVAIIVLFLFLNLALSTISRDDLDLVLPAGVTKRLGIRKEALPDSRM